MRRSEGVATLRHIVTDKLSQGMFLFHNTQLKRLICFRGDEAF